MTTEYTKRMTVAAPESLIEQANHLALIIGESAADIQTFQSANWQNESGDLYAVCSTVAKPSVLSILDAGLPEALPAHAEAADIAKAQVALDAVKAGVILLDVDGDPLTVLADWGLTRIESTEI